MTPSDLFVIEDYRQVYEAVALPVLIIDHASWRILAVNEAALNQYGYERDEFVGLPVLEVRPPEGRDEARQVMSELPHGFWKTTAVRHCRKDGSLFTADVWSRDTVVDGRPVRIATIHEVTERVQIQRELQQAQKMEVVGRLAGGVAHDFNNALTAIIAGSHLLLEQFRDDPEARTDLEAILESADRAALLTRHLLAFSRQQVMRVETHPLAEVVERSVGLLERVLEDHIELRTRIDPGTWPVRVDAVQLEQVIINMAVNAQDAMPGGGTLVLATENIHVSRQDASREPAVPAGDYAVLTVSDTGTGMDEITRARVFEPFFTTKPPPEGTGLGLSMAYGIVRQSGGYITVDSAPGAGTTFRIFLPRAGGTSAEATSIAEAAPPEDRTVLVVDGDDGVRRSTCRVLERLGYTVISTASAEGALTMMHGSRKVPDLLVTALSLPAMGGGDLADRLEASIPGLRVLFLSGYELEGDDDIRDVAAGRRLLQKPFSVESLIEAVRQVFASPVVDDDREQS
ncbi:MAG: PAS domain S-box protein [Gemmatimonadetes bacterium]|nr:PAS domain S-box protein [Gemmatimonadota bacterium]